MKKRKVVKENHRTSIFVDFKIKNWNGCKSLYFIGGVISNVENFDDKDVDVSGNPIYGCDHENFEFQKDKKMDDLYKFFTLFVFDENMNIIARKTIALTGLTATDMGVVVVAVFTVIMVVGLLLWTFCYCAYRRQKK